VGSRRMRAAHEVRARCLRRGPPGGIAARCGPSGDAGRVAFPVAVAQQALVELARR
jgi:hypothetical protein